MSPKWTGPFVISKDLSSHLVTVQLSPAKEKMFNTSRLQKPYNINKFSSIKDDSEEQMVIEER